MKKFFSTLMVLSVVFLINGCDSWDDLVESISGSGDDEEVISSVVTTSTSTTDTNTTSTAPTTSTASTTAENSNRFDHYNPQAWHGAGVAIVLCRGDARMDSCSIDGKSMGLHGSQDHDRDVWTIRGKSGYGGTITCKRKSKAFAFKVGRSGMTWGGCRK